MRLKISGLLVILMLVFLCQALTPVRKHQTICLRYTLKYGNDTWGKNRTGLLWALSMLGAELPKNSFDRNIRWINDRTFEMNLDSLGFNARAQQALKVICDSVKETEVYKKTKAIDLGYFISITLGSSWHYYRLVGAPENYNDFLKLHRFESTEVFPVTHSTVSKKQRLLKSSFKGDVLSTAYIAEEGIGLVTDNSFSAREYNVMDVMPNGQLRFMVYDSAGTLVPCAEEKYGISGKPAKCLWCHEINIQTVFEKTDSVPGFMGPLTFDRNVKHQNNLLKHYRAGLNSDVDFSKLQDHTQMELLYISFMEPSLEKLSQEWNVPVNHLKKILQSKNTHLYHEFPFLGELYYRDSIQPVSVFKSGKIPSSIREGSAREPDYFKTH